MKFTAEYQVLYLRALCILYEAQNEPMYDRGDKIINTHTLLGFFRGLSHLLTTSL